jgi:hypothetical protein
MFIESWCVTHLKNLFYLIPYMTPIQSELLERTLEEKVYPFKDGDDSDTVGLESIPKYKKRPPLPLSTSFEPISNSRICGPFLSPAELARALCYNSPTWQLIKFYVALTLCYFLKQKKIAFFDSLAKKPEVKERDAVGTQVAVVPQPPFSIEKLRFSTAEISAHFQSIIDKTLNKDTSVKKKDMPKPRKNTRISINLTPFNEYGPIFAYVNYQRVILSLKDRNIRIGLGEDASIDKYEIEDEEVDNELMRQRRIRLEESREGISKGGERFHRIEDEYGKNDDSVSRNYQKMHQKRKDKERRVDWRRRGDGDDDDDDLGNDWTDDRRRERRENKNERRDQRQQQDTGMVRVTTTHQEGPVARSRRGGTVVIPVNEDLNELGFWLHHAGRAWRLMGNPREVLIEFAIQNLKRRCFIHQA